MNGSYIASRVLAAVAVALVGLAFSKCSRATTINGLGGAGIEYVTGGVRIADGSGVSFQGRTWENPVSRTAPLRINETLRIGSVGGRALVVNSARTIGAAALGSAALAVGGAAWGGWQVGSGIADYLGLGDPSGGTRLAPCTSSPSGWCFDEGVTPTGDPTAAGYAVQDLGASAAITKDAACAYALSQQSVLGSYRDYYNPDPPYSFVQDGTTSGRCALRYCTGPGPTGCSQYSTYPRPFVTTTVPNPTACAPYIDFLNPAYSNTNPVVGPDGKCPTGGYHSVTLGTAQTKLGTGSTFPDGVNISAADRLAEGILAKGGAIPGASERTVAGPASVSGDPQVTTENKPDGSTVTTTRTPTTNYTYGGNTINYTTTVVTTINNAGNVTTVTTNTPGSHSDPDTESECAKNPGTLGCMKPGELPTTQPTWQQREVIFAPENLGFSGACPAPVHWELPLSGVQLDWSYQPACDVAPMIRLALLAIAAIGAISVVIRETT